ncbi:MAG: SDR family oxidoreductase [Erythrobacter sp.]|uniref:NAD(P)-dependent oxidoreductase n=1 Tax=Erythrobacter sp. TaxID=1042 RepID=UPI0032ED7BA8
MSAPILVMGATSGIGKLAVQEATHREIPVRAFARSADSLEKSRLVEPFPGDATNREDVAHALKGVRAVIYALGISESLSMLWEKETLFSTTTQILVEAMSEASVRRLVAVTGYGSGRSKDAMSTIEKLGHRALLGRVYADKDRQEQIILHSALQYTIVRPVILTGGPRSGKAKVKRNPTGWHNGIVSRADVAAYLVEAVEDDLDIGRDVVLAR